MNNGKWPLVPLRDVLTHRKEFIEIDDLQTYKRCRVQLHAQGLVLRDTVQGSEIKTKKQQVCRAGELLVAEIDAKLGGYGIVPQELEGAIVSSHYFLFSIDEAKIDRRFLAYFIRTPAFFEQVSAQGTTNYAAIRPGHVLAYMLPLPPPKEQQRLVEKLDPLAAKIKEAKRLRAEADAELSVLLARAAVEFFSEGRWPTIPLGNLLTEDSRNGLGVRPSDSPPGVPILRISAGTSRRDATVDEHDVRYLQVGTKELEMYRLRKGDLLACRFNGNLHYVGRFSLYRQEQQDDRVYPDKLIRFRVDATRVLPEFVCLAMNSPAGREATEAFCTTTAGNIGISAKQLKTIPVPLPALAEQRAIIARLGALQAHIQRSIGEGGKVRAELDATLPSILDRAFRAEL
ncbi:MAG: restriction endonuclease subunit S [Pirellulales bacterium]